MGVFALFRRKSKDAVETAAVTESVTEEPEAAEAGETAEAGTGTPEPAAEAAAEASAEGSAEVVDDAGPVVKDGTVEIPKQQSAEEAADSGAAGEGARK
ncbi:hypothetical protein KV205_15045 [Streptomyces sp. SKN60]|uniref:hypothetical protein n=1 Tax=Streptomyces sp. SKN60 TaxID=2855506 RepID=UPI002247047E|nr:hypothetical protein [Streptomyces sp. SKN60]MCX2181841.1 hypothetical protein [Streptomyces sp. SKN60]